ncbi:hypothetical protein BofuT4_P155070.1 [Botrytis cinerea T4]|uniref:Uncharacterized protein n=1 Tax=Botryotinia fuckeliana (strain T4) TaxID=999810 RepID=G2YV68_BOTF4|nr:hypothetical protein BofuT4_P155070.1 [Botrytis cinerea T4]
MRVGSIPFSGWLRPSIPLYLGKRNTHGIFAGVPLASTLIYQHFATIVGDDVHPSPLCV